MALRLWKRILVIILNPLSSRVPPVSQSGDALGFRDLIKSR